jgi:hypothetical protein
MSKWEYLVYKQEYPDNLQEWLNSMGQDGWELSHMEYGLFIVFKRELSSRPQWMVSGVDFANSSDSTIVQIVPVISDKSTCCDKDKR